MLLRHPTAEPPVKKNNPAATSAVLSFASCLILFSSSFTLSAQASVVGIGDGLLVGLMVGRAVGLFGVEVGLDVALW